MFIVPLSKLSDPLTVVTRSLSRTPDKVTPPKELTILAVSVCPKDKEPVQEFPDKFENVAEPKSIALAAPVGKRKPVDVVETIVDPVATANDAVEYPDVVGLPEPS
jgi:hypothetical protein